MNMPVDWSALNKKYQQILNKPKLMNGRFYRVISSDEVFTYGILVYHNNTWAELQIDNNFKVFYFDNNKFELGVE